jgi:SAM-dependent methyltransferase
MARSPKNKPACPVCGGEAAHTLHLRAQEQKSDIEKRFHANSALEFPDYDIYTCRNCDLQFADPMLPGDNDFYEWLGHQPTYHAEERREWSIVRDEIARRNAKVVLDVGCGGGKFIETLSGVDARGIDINRPAIEAARRKGLNVEVGTLADIGGAFDVIVMNHFLEHVPDPLGLVNEAKQRLTPGGALIVSVPYSPMSGEFPKLDPMNLPPHHLTRWNEQSLRMLAKCAGLSVDLRMGKSKPLLQKALQAAKRSDAPLKTFLAARRHLAARRCGGRRAAEEVVAVLSA